MSSDGISITVDTSRLNSLLGQLRATEIPKAARNILRDLARDIATAEKVEIGHVFDKPTPYVQGAFRILKRAETTDLTTEVGVANYRIERALKPSIPRFASSRRLKAIEDRARDFRLLGDDQWLVPSSEMKLDRYGNISKTTARNIMTDLALQYAGRKGKYQYAYRKGRPPKLMGIFLTSKLEKKSAPRTGALQLVAVDKDPRYMKRFKYFELAINRAHVAIPIYARNTIDVIRRRHGL